MKKFTALLAAVMVISLFVSALTVAPAALDSGDWEIVNHSSGTPANVKIEKTAANGIRLSHEGHYPASNAGLLYKNPLNLKDGITLNVTIETSAEGSGDAWYGFWLLNKPLYFDYSNKNGGKGLVLLCRPGGAHQWHVIDDSGFHMLSTDYGADDKDYYEAGVTVEYEIKNIDGALAVVVDGALVEEEKLNDILKFFENDEAYIGFSMSQTELEYQSFVINSLNGEAPASTGDAIPMESGSSTTPETTVDPNAPDWNDPDLKSFTLIDFTKPEVVGSLTSNDCKLSYDEVEGALKVEVTGPDPYVNIPMKKAWYFDGDTFCIVKMDYKTDYEGEGTFYYTTKEVPSMEICSLQIDIEATEGAYKTFEMDMQESSYWTGEIRNFRIDPAAQGEEGQVFYFKNINFEVWEDDNPQPETKPETTDAKTEADTDAQTEATTEAKTDAATKAPETNGSKENPSNENKGVPVFVWVIIGVVAAAAIAAVIVIVTKKKK